MRHRGGRAVGRSAVGDDVLAAQPGGSSDKLYEISTDLQLVPHRRSVGGTPANRMIHRESNQLLIGPYVIDAAARTCA